MGKTIAPVRAIHHYFMVWNDANPSIPVTGLGTSDFTMRYVKNKVVQSLDDVEVYEVGTLTGLYHVTNQGSDTPWLGEEGDDIYLTVSYTLLPDERVFEYLFTDGIVSPRLSFQLSQSIPLFLPIDTFPFVLDPNLQVTDAFGSIIQAAEFSGVGELYIYRVRDGIFGLIAGPLTPIAYNNSLALPYTMLATDWIAGDILVQMFAGGTVTRGGVLYYLPINSVCTVIQSPQVCSPLDISTLALEANVEGHVTDALNTYDGPTKDEMDSAIAGITIDPEDIEAAVTAALNTYDPPTKEEMDDGFAGITIDAGAIADAVWSGDVGTILKKIFGLLYANYRLQSPVFNVDGNLTTATIIVYADRTKAAELLRLAIAVHYDVDGHFEYFEVLEST